jgi:hypothetical protein
MKEAAQMIDKIENGRKFAAIVKGKPGMLPEIGETIVSAAGVEAKVESLVYNADRNRIEIVAGGQKIAQNALADLIAKGAVTVR